MLNALVLAGALLAGHGGVTHADRAPWSLPVVANCAAGEVIAALTPYDVTPQTADGIFEAAHECFIETVEHHDTDADYLLIASRLLYVEGLCAEALGDGGEEKMYTLASLMYEASAKSVTVWPGEPVYVYLRRY